MSLRLIKEINSSIRKGISNIRQFLLKRVKVLAVPYNPVFLFNVGLGFFLCSVGEISALLGLHLQQPILSKNEPVQNKNR